ncbi:lipopolysaccharide biosynthesis protein [Flavobacterium sp. DG2-3]|uniref:lipopolysaccharide biosynthesis protein n=1 Tax=Flavobacterium sp. DG2-3 TaxID=3068317 RepID=UPI00273D746A|nr:oligosaccharide flippase family protein [Flavobacterium sp. DG2-3]MDP5200717.1 oligosaccharide flippase family protein [Flavobacterium sp. DG2-3]
MNLKLIKNILLYGIGDFIVTGVTAFLFIPLYIKFLSPEDYGIFNILNNNSALFTYFIQFGIVSAFGRIYFLKKALNKETEYTWNIIVLHFISSTFLMLFYFLFKDFLLDQLAPSIAKSNIVYFSPIIAFLSFLPALYYIYLRLENKVTRFVFFQILTVLVISAILLLIFIFFQIDLNSILFSFIIGNLIVWFVVIFNFKIKINFNFKDMSETIVFGFPIFISYIAYFFISKYSVIILQKYVSLSEIGLFSLAQQIATVPTLITIAISKAVQPLLFSSESDEELQLKSQRFDFNFKLIMIWIVGSIIFFIDFLFHFFLPEKYSPIMNTTIYLLIINLIYNFAIVENTILLYKMKSKIILLITLTGSIINVVLSNYLVQSYALNGVLIATAVAFLVNFLLSVYFSRKHLKIDYSLNTIFLSSLIIAFYILISSSVIFKASITYKNILSIGCFLVLTTLVLLILKQKHVSVKN